MKKNIVEENSENDEEHNDEENDENYDYITDRNFEASRLRGFCNRNQNFNIQLRKFNSGENVIATMHFFEDYRRQCS